MSLSRRRFIQNTLYGMAGLAFGRRVSAQPFNDALVLDKTHNIAIPRGCQLRLVAKSSKQVLSSAPYKWHAAPDGGACFSTADNGWIYVSNSELRNKRGGVGALRFNAEGDVTDAYSILAGTTRNCAGGKTPWHTWLSCEENGDAGLVYECDPVGQREARVRPGMGAFNHEAVAVDPLSSICYMTEDVKDGCLYRFIPTDKNNLERGQLQVALANKQTLSWQPIPDASASRIPTRYQVKDAARFRGGEGIVYDRRKIYFTTKLDNVVWCYFIDTGVITRIYSAAQYQSPLLTGVDNIEVSASGEVLIAEDGGNMQIIALDHRHTPYVLLQVYGQDRSEITGPAFSPDGQRLYFSSQRGRSGKSQDGLTYELRFPVDA